MRTLSQRVREVFGTSCTPTLSLKSRLGGREHVTKQTPNRQFWTFFWSIQTPTTTSFLRPNSWSSDLVIEKYDLMYHYL